MNIFSTNEYRCLNFVGNTGGNSLSPDFDINELKQKYLTIKSIKVVPFSPALYDSVVRVESDTSDFTGTKTYHLAAANHRLSNDNLFERHSDGLKINFRINDIPLNMFASANNGFNIDFFVDNIFSCYPEKVQSIDIKLNAKYYMNYSDLASSEEPYQVKLIVECYLTSYNPMTRIKELKAFERLEKY